MTLPRDPRSPAPKCSKSLTRLEEAVTVAFRAFTQLPLDDCLYSLRKSIRAA